MSKLSLYRMMNQHRTQYYDGKYELLCE